MILILYLFAKFISYLIVWTEVDLQYGCSYIKSKIINNRALDAMM